MKKIVFLLILLSCSIAAQSGRFNDWVTSLVKDSSGTIYAGTSSNGIFMSADNGNHWLATKMKYGVNSITLTRSGSIISFAFGYSYGRYLFRLSGNGLLLDSISLNFTPAYIVSGKNGLLYAAAFSEGYYVSDDNGDNWNRIETGFDPSFTFPVIDATKDSTLFIGSKTGVWRSSDNGTNWEQGFFNYHDSLTVQHIIAVNDSTIYAGAFEGMGIELNEFFVSSDTGKNWNLIGSTDLNPDAMTLDSTGNIFIGNKNGVYSVSSDGEISHLGLDSISVNDFGVRSLLILGRDSILAGGFGGVYFSSNGGLNWEFSSNGLLSDTLVGSYTSSVPFGYYISSGLIAGNGDYIVGTDSAGIFRSADKGKTWMQTNLTVPLITCVVHDSVGHLFAASLNNGVFRSANNGLSWTQTEEYILNDRKIYTLAGHKAMVPMYGTDTTHLVPQNCCFAGTDWGIYRYFIGSDIWSPMGLNNIIAIEPLSSRDIVAGTPGGDIYLSSGGWNEFKLKGNVGEQLKVIVSDSSEFLYAAGTGGLFRSTDKGLTWESKNSGIIDYDLISAAADNWGNIFVGSQSGDIYKSSDQGEHWIKQAALNYPVRNIFIEPDNVKVYVTVAGRLFSIDNSPSVNVRSSEVSVRNFSLSQNYPNPFNPSTIINYSLLKSSFVKIEIYNILGQRVAVLVNNTRQAGKYTVKWNAEGFASGVYLYRLEALSLDAKNNFVEVKKMILLK